MKPACDNPPPPLLTHVGSYWGRLGFFRVARGVNSMHIEEGDCWYADPDLSMERLVEEGELVGSMDGLIRPPRSHGGAAN